MRGRQQIEFIIIFKIVKEKNLTLYPLSITSKTKKHLFCFFQLIKVLICYSFSIPQTSVKGIKFSAYFGKNFMAIITRVLHLSESVFVTVQNCPVFSIMRLNGASKKTNFEGNYLANRKSYDKSLYEVQIGNPCVPIGGIARI